MADRSELLKRLRTVTQAGMMDCKKALDASGDDFDQAVKWLRENGIAKAAKKESAVAAEGVIVLGGNNKLAALAEINAQTDFAARNEAFINFAEGVQTLLSSGKVSDLATLRASSLPSKQTVSEAETSLTATIGEKIAVRRVKLVSAQANETLATYVHANKRIGVILRVSGAADASFLKHLAMHVAANNPRFINEASVDQTWLANEKTLIYSQMQTDEAVAAKLAKMPDAAKKQELLEKIGVGRISKLLAEVCLESQAWLIDSTQKVGAILKQQGLHVVEMVRFEVGEGIEKKVDDFAAEVQAQMGGK